MGYKKAFCRKSEAKQVVRCGGQMKPLSKGFPLGGQQMIFYNLIKPQSSPNHHHCSQNMCCNIFCFALKNASDTTDSYLTWISQKKYFLNLLSRFCAAGFFL